MDKKHINIFMEGELNRIDFNFYSQIGAFKHDIQAIYKNGDSVHVDIEAEGSDDSLNKYIDYLENGPLRKYINKFRIETANFVEIQGFTSLKVHEDEYSFLQKLKRKFL